LLKLIFFVLFEYFFQEPAAVPAGSTQTDDDEMTRVLEVSRSEEAQLREAISKDEQDLADYLQQQGFAITEASRRARNGDCWASALAFGYNRQSSNSESSSITPAAVRELAVATLKEHCDTRYLDFFTCKDDTEDPARRRELFLQECCSMEKPGNWTSETSNIGEFLVDAFAKGSQSTIVIFNSDKSTTTVKDKEDSEGLKVIHLAHTLTKGHEHYHGVEQVVVPSSPLPLDQQVVTSQQPEEERLANPPTEVSFFFLNINLFKFQILFILTEPSEANKTP
jgi:hypothetical protein